MWTKTAYLVLWNENDFWPLIITPLVTVFTETCGKMFDHIVKPQVEKFSWCGMAQP